MSFIRKQRRNGRVYLSEVENHWVDGKCKQKFIRYIGVDPDCDREAFPTCNDELSLDGVKLHGSVLVLNSIAKQLNLHELLGNHFAPILALVYCHCHDYKSVRNMEKWFDQVNFYKILGVGKITENDLHNALKAIEQMSTRTIEKSVFGAPRGVLKPEVKVLTWRLSGDRANRKHYPVYQGSSFELMEGNHMSYA